MVYYGERIQNKMNLGKNYQVKVQESMKLRASSCPLLAKSRTAWLSLHWCLVIYMEYCQPGSSPKSWCPHFFIEASSHNHSWLTTWLLSIYRPSGNQSNTVWPKAPTPNHIVIHLIFPRQQATKTQPSKGLEITSRSQEPVLDLSLGTQRIIQMVDFSHGIVNCVCLLQWKWDPWGQTPGNMQCFDGGWMKK